MENLYFILVPVVFISVFLVFKFFKMEQDYKSKSKEIQQKIEELKARNSLCQNKINKKVKAELTKKIEKSSLKSNAKNRLLSELSKILILTNTMGWTLKYDGREVKTDKDIELKIIN